MWSGNRHLLLGCLIVGILWGLLGAPLGGVRGRILLLGAPLGGVRGRILLVGAPMGGVR